MRNEIDAVLDHVLPRTEEWPSTLHEAMRYSVFAGGKRLRPLLCLASTLACGGDPFQALWPAAAIECLHTHTLIHDDLPAMDNDNLRRGKPTLHKVYGEATAILAGDALLTLAFEILSQVRGGARLAYELARAAGSRGVAGGQFEDLAAEKSQPDLERVRKIHQCKTAALFAASCRIGALVAEAQEGLVDLLGRFGEKVGMAFQIVDDVLNVISTPEELGKGVGSDASRCKVTFVNTVGVEQARRESAQLVAEALSELDSLAGEKGPLQEIGNLIIKRTH